MHFTRSSSVVSRRVGDEVVLVPVANNVADLDSVYTLSPVAALVWDVLESPATLDVLVGHVIREYDVDEDTARADVGELIADLASAGLVSETAS